jgi:hypothetical protein
VTESPALMMGVTKPMALTNSVASTSQRTRGRVFKM